MLHRDWVKSLKVGDAVVSNFSKYAGREWRRGTVTRVTASSVFVKFDNNEKRFNMRGASVGSGDYYRTYLTEASQELLDLADDTEARMKASAKIRHANLDNVETARLVQAAAILSGE